MNDLKEKIDELVKLINTIKNDLPYGVNDIDDMDKIIYEPDAIYVRYYNQNFLSEDHLGEFLKECVDKDDLVDLVLRGGLESEYRPLAWNEDHDYNDGETYFNSIDELNEFENTIEEIKELANDLENENICVLNTSFDNIEDNANNQLIENLQEQLEQELDEKEHVTVTRVLKI